MSALSGISVVDLSETVAGEYCAKLLADFGAEVIKIEAPLTGSPTRHMAPIKPLPDGSSCSALFAWLNTNKRSLCLDLPHEHDLTTLHNLIAEADVVIDDHDMAWLASRHLAPQDFERLFPATTLCSITPHGLDAPQELWHAANLNVFHDSGWGYHTPTAANPSQPPLKGPGRFLVDYEAGTDAASAILSSLYWRQHSGYGQIIDVAKRNVLISRADLVLGRILAGEDPATTSRTAYDQAGPAAVFPCADGAVYLYITNQKHWRGLRELMDNPDWMADYDDDWLEFGVTPALVRRFQDGFRVWVADKTRVEISNAGQRLGVPLVPVNTAADIHHSPQFRFRQFFRCHRHPTLGDLALPSAPFRMSATQPCPLGPAPDLGSETNAAFLTQRQHFPSVHKGQERSSRGPLAGLRVVEITKVWAGPYAGKMLAFLGAEVIKVESHTNLDELRAFGGVDIDQAPFFLSVNQEVKSVQANMKTPQGIELVRKLIANCDILINNLRPGAMERLGLDPETLLAINPRLIAVSIKMYGNDGPLGEQTGYAPCFAALGGLHHLVGHEASQPLGTNMRYGDSTVGACAVLGSLIALFHREQTGEGQSVDISAVECMAAMAGDVLVQHAMTGEVPGPDGNLHSEYAPHGVYPCRDGAWLCLAVSSDDEWLTLCHQLGNPALASRPEFADADTRRANASLLDDEIGRLTRVRNADALAAQLCRAGVSASKSLSSLDMIGDEILWHSGVFRHVSDHRQGSRPIIAPGWRMSRTDHHIGRGGPRLGEHNHQVYGDLLGLTAAEIAALQRDGVIY